MLFNSLRRVGLAWKPFRTGIGGVLALRPHRLLLFAESLGREEVGVIEPLDWEIGEGSMALVKGCRSRGSSLDVAPGTPRKVSECSILKKLLEREFCNLKYSNNG